MQGVFVVVVVVYEVVQDVVVVGCDDQLVDWQVYVVCQVVGEDVVEVVGWY